MCIRHALGNNGPLSFYHSFTIFFEARYSAHFNGKIPQWYSEARAVTEAFESLLKRPSKAGFLQVGYSPGTV